MADLPTDIRTLIEGGIDPVTFDEVTDLDRRPHAPRHRMVARLVSVAVLVGVCVPVVLALSSARPTSTATHPGGERHRILAALSQTIASGSFDISFSEGQVTPPTSPTTTTCPTSPSTGSAAETPTSPTVGPSPGSYNCYSEPSGPGLAFSGTGTIDTSPFAMVAVSQVPGFGQIVLHDNGTNVWETGGGNYGQSPIRWLQAPDHRCPALPAPSRAPWDPVKVLSP